MLASKASVRQLTGLGAQRSQIVCQIGREPALPELERFREER